MSDSRRTEPDMSERARVLRGNEPGGTAGRSGNPWADRARSEISRRSSESPEILDACCGGRMWWWDKQHPLAVYMDIREVPEVPETLVKRGRVWRCTPDLVGDFRSMPFADETFRMVLFDPPHIVRDQPSGYTALHYGALHSATEQDDLRRGFSECWRVLAPGGTLIFKWAGALDRVRQHFPAVPIVGTRYQRNSSSALGTRWFVFYKPVARFASERQEALAV